jgi:hypothetical protein
MIVALFGNPKMSKGRRSADISQHPLKVYCSDNKMYLGRQV